jgi:hypothetical protein
MYLYYIKQTICKTNSYLDNCVTVEEGCWELCICYQNITQNADFYHYQSVEL